MKKQIKFLPFLFFVACMVLNSCSDEEIGKEIGENEAVLTKSDSNSVFPEVEEVNIVDYESLEYDEIASFVSAVGNYNVDFTQMELVEFEGYQDHNSYSIPFIDNEDKTLLVIQNMDEGKIMIGRKSILPNENTLYKVSNYQDEPLYQIEINQEEKMGNQLIFDNDNGHFLFDFTFNQSELAKKGTCLETTTEFGACMQCAWDECSSSWICGAVLAVKPVEVILFSAALCGLNTVANLK